MRKKRVLELLLLLGSSVWWKSALKLGSGHVNLAPRILWTWEAMLILPKFENLGAQKSLWSAAQIEPSAPEMPGVSVGDGAGFPFHVCPGLDMLCQHSCVLSDSDE